MRYYYTYKITCLKGSLKGCYYFGQHTTKNLDDGYCGCGRVIKDYYSKYGAIENVTYIKEILNFYSNATELNEAEYLLVGDKYQNDPKCLNLRAGGVQAGMCDETLAKISESVKIAMQDPKIKEKMHISLTEASKRPEVHEKRSKAAKGNNHAKGSIRTDEMKQVQSEIQKKRFENPEERIKTSEATSKAMRKPEVREKCGSGTRGKRWRLNPETNKREYYI